MGASCGLTWGGPGQVFATTRIRPDGSIFVMNALPGLRLVGVPPHPSLFHGRWRAGQAQRVKWQDRVAVRHRLAALQDHNRHPPSVQVVHG